MTQTGTAELGALATAEPASAGPPGGPLGEYRQRKLALAELIRESMTLAHERHDEQREGSARELLARLAEDAFQLAVVGQFSRGKSTLMNAILGGPYLPTGALPMTSVLTTVRYGSEPRAEVRRAGSSTPLEVPLDELVRFVAQQSGERQELQIVAADVQLPAEILRFGFSFVDTPGIGSPITTNTATTEEFLPQADAVIFVTSCDAPLSEAEQEFLATVRRHVEKLFLVVNKTDLVSPAEVAGAISYVRAQLAEHSTEIRVSALSARRALQARLAGDRVGLSESGLTAFEQPLVEFLTGEKSRVFLEQTCRRAHRLCKRQQADLQLARAAQTPDAAMHSDTSQRLDARLSELAGEAHTLAVGVRDQLARRIAPALVERSRSWPQELGERLAPLLGQDGEQQHTRRRLQQQLATIGQSAQPLVEEWLAERVAEVHTLLFVTAGERIRALLEQPLQAQRVAAELLEQPALDDADSGRSTAELPPLHPPRLAFGEHLELPGRRSRSGVKHPAERLREALQGGVSAYCEQARDALAHAAEGWAITLDERVQRELVKAGKRVHGRLQTPYRDDHAKRLGQLGSSLARFEGGLAAWTPIAGSVEQLDEGLPPAAASTSGACAVCTRVGMVPFGFLAHEQYQLATRRERRVEHAAGGGFCPLHTWLYAQSADPVGIALTYAQLAATLSAQLRNLQTHAPLTAELQEAVEHFIPTGERCPVCRALQAAEHEAIAQVLDELGEEPAGPDLCVGHLAAVLAAGPPLEQARALTARLAEAMGRAAEDMRTFALKRESLRRGLLSGDERAAYLQTIQRLAGHRELARPWRTDDDDRLP